MKRRVTIRQGIEDCFHLEVCSLAPQKIHSALGPRKFKTIPLSVQNQLKVYLTPIVLDSKPKQETKKAMD